jgi:hypothetical protein
VPGGAVTLCIFSCDTREDSLVVDVDRFDQQADDHRRQLACVVRGDAKCRNVEFEMELRSVEAVVGALIM